jgi:hypothetical protein
VKNENENVLLVCIGETSFFLIQIKKKERTWEYGKGPQLYPDNKRRGKHNYGDEMKQQ